MVVDSTINADVMEFYAAEDARGGVLEAAGAASIKFRDRDVVQTAHRIDHVLMEYDRLLKELKMKDVSTSVNDEMKALEVKIKQRERMLFGVFQQVRNKFSTLYIINLFLGTVSNNINMLIIISMITLAIYIRQYPFHMSIKLAYYY